MQRTHLKKERIRCTLMRLFWIWNISNKLCDQPGSGRTNNLLHLRKVSQSIQQESLVLACFRNWISCPQLRFQVLLKIKSSHLICCGSESKARIFCMDNRCRKRQKEVCYIGKDRRKNLYIILSDLRKINGVERNFICAEHWTIKSIWG